MIAPPELHLVSWNRPKMTELVIRTIHKNTKRENFVLVVWDNGSDQETLDMLGRLGDEGLIDEMHFSKTNQGLEVARQNLLWKCNRQYFICVDNDCLPQRMVDGKDWVERLVDLMEAYPDFAAISCRTQVMIGTGEIFADSDAAGDDLLEFPHPGGSLRIMRTHDVKAVGGWDRGAEGRGAEERYIGAKLHEAGFRTAFAVRVTTMHLFGTRGDNGTDRWGYDKDLPPEATGHSDIAHPALTNGDSTNDLLDYADAEDVARYFE